MNHADQITAVVDDNLRAIFQGFPDMATVLFLCGTVKCKNPQPVFHKSRCNIILGRKDIAAGNGHLRAACSQNFTKISRLRLQMNRKRDF